jgi:hypothetical protein
MQVSLRQYPGDVDTCLNCNGSSHRWGDSCWIARTICDLFAGKRYVAAAFRSAKGVRTIRSELQTQANTSGCVLFFAAALIMTRMLNTKLNRSGNARTSWTTSFKRPDQTYRSRHSALPASGVSTRRMFAAAKDAQPKTWNLISIDLGAVTYSASYYKLNPNSTYRLRLFVKSSSIQTAMMSKLAQ